MKGNGVSSYAEFTISIFFEHDHIACQYCPLLETYSRNMCRRTGEYVFDTRTVGNWCPLIPRNPLDLSEKSDGLQ